MRVVCKRQGLHGTEPMISGKSHDPVESQEAEPGAACWGTASNDTVGTVEH